MHRDIEQQSGSASYDFDSDGTPNILFQRSDIHGDTESVFNLYAFHSSDTQILQSPLYQALPLSPGDLLSDSPAFGVWGNGEVGGAQIWTGGAQIWSTHVNWNTRSSITTGVGADSMDYLGFRFGDEGAWQYGWVEFQPDYNLHAPPLNWALNTPWPSALAYETSVNTPILVPEPSSAAFIGIGLGVLIYLRRRGYQASGAVTRLFRGWCDNQPARD